MTIKGGLQSKAPGNPYDETDEGVFISVIKEGSVASRESRLCVGQRIIEVNGQNLLGAEHLEAVNTMRSVGDELNILVCDGYNNITDSGDKRASVASIDNAEGVKEKVRKHSCVIIVRGELFIRALHKSIRPSYISLVSVSPKIMDVVRATEEQIMDAVRETEDALLRPKSPGARSLGEESERRSTTVKMEGHSSQMPQTSTVSGLKETKVNSILSSVQPFRVTVQLSRISCGSDLTFFSLFPPFHRHSFCPRLHFPHFFPHLLQQPCTDGMTSE